MQRKLFELINALVLTTDAVDLLVKSAWLIAVKVFA
jgi:hypothetical protein